MNALRTRLDPMTIALDDWPPSFRPEADFHRLPAREQSCIKHLWWAMLVIEQGRSVNDGARRAAKMFLGEYGRSRQHLSRFYRRWIAAEKHWSALRNFTRAPKREPEAKWDPRFVDYLGGLMQQFQRNSERALRAFHREFRAGKSVPGLGTWRTVFRARFGDAEPMPRECPRLNDLLPGLTIANLRRIATPPRRDLVIARIGTAAAHALLPHVPRTREGVRFLEYVFIDDLWRDRKVIAPGESAPCRLLQFNVIDLASSVLLKFGMRPERTLPDGTRDRLKWHDVLWVIGMMVEEYGLPLDYAMRVICERGTATVPPASARAIYELTGGRVIIGYTGMNGEFVCGWDEKPVGNWMGKGLLESFNALIHNADGGAPGQVGKDRDHSPARLAAQEKLAERMIAVGSLLPRELQARFKPPFATVEEAFYQTLDLLNVIHDDPDHRCEGFEPVQVWRLLGSRDEFQHIATLANFPTLTGAQVEWSSRLETRRERMLKLRAANRFAAVEPWMLRHFYESFHVEATIDAKGYFAFWYQKKFYRFRSTRDADDLPEGTDCLGYFNPLDMSRIILTHNGGSKHGAYVACWVRAQANWQDTDSQADELRHVHRTLSKSLADIERRNKYQIAEQLDTEREALETLRDANLLTSEGGSDVNPAPTEFAEPEPGPDDTSQNAAVVNPPPPRPNGGPVLQESSEAGNGNGTALQSPRFPAPATPDISAVAARVEGGPAGPRSTPAATTLGARIAEAFGDNNRSRARARSEKQETFDAAREAQETILDTDLMT